MQMRLAAPLLITAIAVAGTGCGDDSGGSSAPSKAAYIQQADAICREGNAQLHAAEARFFAKQSQPSAKQEQKYSIEVFVPNIENQLATLRKLPAAKGDERRVNAVWDAAAAGLAELKADPASFGGTPPAGFRKAKQLATAYGFKVCGDT